MTVRQLLREIDSREIAEWMAHDSLTNEENLQRQLELEAQAKASMPRRGRWR